MSYIVPDGQIQLFKNIPLSPDNENTLFFATSAAKDAYFDTLQQTAAYSLGAFNNATYSREERGFVRINAQVGSVYNACYMRFKNTSFENKWFYAFVTSVEYIANKTIQINYTLDYMVTYMGEFTLEQCFIERETVNDDRIGVNTLDEGLEIGHYVDEGIFNLVSASSAKVVVVVANPSEMGTGDPIDSHMYNPAVMKAFDTAAAANTYILQLVNGALGDNILGVFMIPSEYADAVTNATHSGTNRKTVSKPYTSINGYVPKNKKLFVYPYKKLVIDNNEGATQDYRYEYFDSDAGLPASSNDCIFVQFYSICGTCEALLEPLNYMTGTQTLGDNPGARIGKQSFPECGWAIDSYKAYRAQINSNLPLQQLTGIQQGALQGGVSGWTGGGDVPIISNLIGAAGGAAMGAAMGFLTPTLEALAVNTIEVERGTQVKGSMSPNTMFSILMRKTFSGSKQCVDRAHAIALDDYFTMFGYKVNKVATPNMNIRTYFTYIKTIGCTVNGEMPADYMRAIENRFNAGVRFWKSVTTIGNYSLDNRANLR